MTRMTHAFPSASPDRSIDDDACWDAFVARDKGRDGDFVGAVLTTGIYCKPSCPARRPRRENMRFFADGAAARAAGFRACLRCCPDDVARDVRAVERALTLIGNAETPLALEALAQAVGYAPHHFHRLFRRATGVTPAAYARQLRADRLTAALDAGGSVTGAVYNAGYNAPSRAYADADQRLGMTPGAWRDGGRGVVIRHMIADTSLGPMLIAATDKGLCRISFDEDGASLARRFPGAEIRAADDDFTALASRVIALVDDPTRAADLPMDVRGTIFQQAVWQALRAIPAGETRSYGQIAASIGRPHAVRATGTACGANALAVLIPCHRVVRGDGATGAYAYGAARKAALLDRERKG